MKVKEVIQELQKLDPDALVVVDGYEEGFAEDIRVCAVELVRDGTGDTDSIYGRHSRPKWAGRPADLFAVFIGEGRHLR